MERGVSRISVSIPVALLKEFDETRVEMGYRDRSKAMQTAMRNFISEYRWTRTEEDTGTGALIIVYDHGVKGLGEALTEIQHHHEGIINAVMHIHLDEHNCLEIVAVRGRNVDIRDLSRELMTKRGVKQLKLTIV
ncbi:MAG: nickel-responsive transcriptional regulator NikR [Nitrososphaeria archaeon]|nr:nickel-responsive transcriptional regulator NikR [Nitrososphaeria archaeon]NIN53478.1 nickel-responsive transcriptional regulator NikR [Nitrososphaeria archaeon]NIQ33995.1 nickel-responsive transcriptional regulator NikR [Nitrososphaeria archaeon]